MLRIFVTLVILASIVVGVLALTLPRDQIVNIIVFRDFFDVSLPILGFGALIKYLVSGIKHHHHGLHCHDSDCKDKT